MAFFKPTHYTKLNNLPKQTFDPSDELLFAIKKMKYENGDIKKPIGDESTQWIYIEDCLRRKTITPLEAYGSIKLGYVPEHLRFRKSFYSCL